MKLGRKHFNLIQLHPIFQTYSLHPSLSGRNVGELLCGGRRESLLNAHSKTKSSKRVKKR